MIENILDILRAKPKKDKNYLLRDHIKETITRAIQLRNFINNNKSSIQYENFDKNFFKNLIVACFLHDLGKISYKIQLRLLDKNERKNSDEKNILDNFFYEFKDIKIRDHEVISLIYSLIFLKNDDWDKKIRTSILLHHYNDFYVNKDINIRYIIDSYPDLERYVDFLLSKKNEIKKLLSELLSYLINSFQDNEAKEVLENLKNSIDFDRLEEFKNCIEEGHSLSYKLKMFNIQREEEEYYDFFVFLGCLRRCDYSASSGIDIEILEENLKNKIYEEISERIGKYIERKYNKKEKIWQEKILEKKDNNTLVLIAPTGSGKTEFALLWAKNRGKKLIYTLPIRVALNDLYYRFGSYCCLEEDCSEKKYDKKYHSILHSTSFIEYLKEDRNYNYNEVEIKKNSSKMFSYPILLATPDQILLSSLKFYGFDKLLSVYPLSAIVIDEIQTYTPEMAAIIIKTLEIIKKLKSDVLIITATFPPYFKKFWNNYFGEKNIIDIKDESKEIKENVKNYKLKRHKIELIEKRLFNYNNKKFILNKNSIEELEKKLSDNKDKNILIIVNNVSKSIELYKKLEKYQNVYLLHSRLIEKEKDRRITEIKEKLEKFKEKIKNNEKVEENDRIILIATQIIEASVDVDFDLLITEISTIDSQIQRWGRIYRNRDKDYQDSKPNISIFIGDDKDTGIDEGTKAIYDTRVVEKTIEILKKEIGKNINKTLDYEEERNLINKVFEEKVGNKKIINIFEDEIESNLEYMKILHPMKRSEAQRIFRRIAGINILIPELMKKDAESLIARELGEIIENSKNSNLSWKEIIEKIRSKINSKEEINEWLLKKIMHDYSVTIPIFYLENNYYKIISHEFKGTFVINSEELYKKDSKIIERIMKYGIDELFNVFEIDAKEIEEYSNII